MNCPSRTETDPSARDGWNQNPPALAAELTTREDLNGRANRREIDQSGTSEADGRDVDRRQDPTNLDTTDRKEGEAAPERPASAIAVQETEGNAQSARRSTGSSPLERASAFGAKMWSVLVKYSKFVGPGFMVAVAYIDPGNYATDVAAGASYRFKLLFIVLMSNLFAIFLQALCIKLGSVTGLNLAENCKAHLPPWLNYTLYFFAESAIIATDIAEVIGTAIALNLLLHIPLVAGCAISILDVLIILFFYHPSGSMRALRAFEFFVMALVLGVVICFCFQLSLLKNTSVGEVFRGYLPSSAIVQGQGLFQSCGILGATVMPHSLFLGSGIVQARLKDFDDKSGTNPNASSTELTANPTAASTTAITPDDATDDAEPAKYRPSLAAIRSCMSYSVVELAISLFTFALFVNSAILIVAGSSLFDSTSATSADLFGIHDLLSKALAPAAGTIFALALLLSGTSAGIVCTIAGQMVSEGMLNWSCRPWVRRLVTRSISITPSIIIAGAVGGEGLSKALEGSQVALSVILPVVSAPLIWFTCRERYMSVTVGEEERREVAEGEVDEAAGRGDAAAEVEEGRGTRHTTMCMKNGWVTATAALLIWGVIVVMNGALIVLVAMGQD